AAPSDVALTINNVGGILTAIGTAGCNAVQGAHPISLDVTNSAGLTSSASFSLVVAPDPPPTLGTYGNATVAAGQSVTVTPSAPPSDPNFNLLRVTASVVVPSPALDVTPFVDTAGVVTIITGRSARLVSYQIQVVAEDACLKTTTRTFFVQVVNSGPQVV